MRFFLEVTVCQSGGSSPISWECLTFLVAPPGRRSTLATAPRQLLSGNIERRGKVLAVDACPRLPRLSRGANCFHLPGTVYFCSGYFCLESHTQP